jgi:hypothetical protein
MLMSQIYAVEHDGLGLVKNIINVNGLIDRLME